VASRTGDPFGSGHAACRAHQSRRDRDYRNIPPRPVKNSGARACGGITHRSHPDRCTGGQSYDGMDGPGFSRPQFNLAVSGALTLNMRMVLGQRKVASAPCLPGEPSPLLHRRSRVGRGDLGVLVACLGLVQTRFLLRHRTVLRAATWAIRSNNAHTI
jgi:hypothetical protein